MAEETPAAVVEKPAAEKPATTDTPVETPAAAAVASTETPASPPAAVDPAKPSDPGTPEGHAPQVPVQYDLTLPEHAPFDASMLPAFAAEATALSLTQPQAQALVAHRASEVTRVRAAIDAQLAADPDLGGAHLPETTQLAGRGLEYVFPKGSKGNDLIRQFLNDSGYGNHPDVIREFVRIGRLRTEDTPVGASSITGPAAKSPEELLYPKMFAPK